MNNSETYNLAYRLSSRLREKYKEVYQITLFPSAWYENFFEIMVRDLHNYDPRPHDIPRGFVEDLMGFIEEFNRSHVEFLSLSVEGVDVDGVDGFCDCLRDCVLPFRLQFTITTATVVDDDLSVVELV